MIRIYIYCFVFRFFLHIFLAHANSATKVRSIEDITASAESGHPADQYSLGRMYYNGFLVKKNYEKAKKWLTMASHNNIHEANMLLGDLYYFGKGVHKNEEKALFFYKNSAQRGVEGASQKILKIAESGNSEAQFFVGYLYEIGLISKALGQICDYRNASKWYSIASKNGSDKARTAFERIAKECYVTEYPSNPCCSTLSFPGP